MTGITIKLEIFVGTVMALIVASLLWNYHERLVGQAELQNSINAATKVAEDKAADETMALQAKANAATQEAIDAQKKLGDYMDSHPLGVVSVCHAAGNGSSGVPSAAGAHGPAATAGAGSGTGGEVHPGSDQQTVDIESELNAVLRSFGSMATVLRQFQAPGR